MDIDLNPEPNNHDRIDAVWLVISSDETGEGVCSIKMGDTWLPLMAADQRRLEIIKPLAKQLAATVKKKLYLIRLDHRTEVEEITP